MAIDQQQKRRNLAVNLINASTRLMDAVNDLNRLADEYQSSGLTFEDGDFNRDDLRHVDAASMTSVISSAQATSAWLESTFHDDNFLKVRP